MIHCKSQISLTGQDRSLNRLTLQRVLRSKELIQSVSVDTARRVFVRTCDWEGYWASAVELDSELRSQLNRLRITREAYFESGCELNQAAPFCHAYFLLLREILERPDKKKSLEALIGLDCFGIQRLGHDTSMAAGSVTIRNPVYLLAKLREPKAYEDAKFLPVICPISTVDSFAGSLYYYYRQVRIQKEPPAALLIYPSTNLSHRPESFATIETLSSALCSQPDPRSKQRATTIADWAIAPFLNHGIQQSKSSSEISFIDIGGGSGALLAEICKRLIRQHQHVLSGRKFSWSILDINLQDASRRTHCPELRRSMSSIEYQSVDYRDWIANQKKPCCPQYDVALICRLLNNMSRIGIETTNDLDIITELTWAKRHPIPGEFHPADCLMGPSPNSRSLIASNSCVRLQDGTTFRQASLSNYFRGLQRISQGNQAESGESLSFPIRRFNSGALRLRDGSSMLGRLSSLVNLIVIEDVDLSEAGLVEHFRKHGLTHLAASDATDRKRMQSASLFCICRREFESHLPGKRLW